MGMARTSSKELSLLANRLSDITGRNLLIESCYGWYNLNDYTDSKNGGCRSVESGLTAKEMRLFLVGALTGTGFMKKNSFHVEQSGNNRVLTKKN